MKRLFLLALPLLALTLVGQGCLSFGGSSSNAADGSIWQTTNAGESWTQLKSFPQASEVGSLAGVNVLDLEIDPNDPTVYYMATRSNGFFYTLDNGATWERPRTKELRDGSITDMEVHPSATCTVYALKGRRLHKSVDCARSFRVMYTESRVEEQLTALAVDWFNPQVVWAGTTAGDILKSIDGGANWQAVHRMRDSISAIEISNADSRIVMVGTEGRGMTRTADSGSTWEDFRQELDREFSDSDNVFGFSQAEDGSVVLMNTEYGPLRSRDAGQTWEGIDLVTAPGEVVVWDVEVNPNEPENLFYGTLGTLYQSVNGGVSWVAVELPSRRAPLNIEVHEDVKNLLLIGFASVED